MDKPNPASHVFFFTVIFMTSIVILTIVGYFLYLPKTAPKLITLGVLPFHAPEDFPDHLSGAFPKHITELLATSRDIFVVDYEAAEEAVALEKKSRGFQNELGTTHVLDGEFEVTNDGWLLKMRLIDVSRRVWKLKWDDEYVHPELSLLEIRNSIVTGVAESLYDNSIPDPTFDNLDTENLERYLQAVSTYRADNASVEAAVQLINSDEHFSPYVAGFLLEVIPNAPMNSRKQWVDRALSDHSNYYPAQVVQTQLNYEEKRNLDDFLSETAFLAGKYPNSAAVQELALLYFDLGWYKEASHVLIRWAQIRPRSSEPALAIAFNKFRLHDVKGVNEALEIARLRDPSNDLVDRYRALYQWKFDGKELQPRESEYLQWILRYETNDFDSADPTWREFVEQLPCYEQIELSLYVKNFDYIFEEYDCTDRRLWIQPPPWWLDDDPKWIAFHEDPRYEVWLDSRGIRSGVLETVAPIPPRELFAPRRTLLRSNDQQTSQ